MNTLYRGALAGLLAATVVVSHVSPAAAQMQRNFPATALRGTLLIGEPPEIALNGKPARLAPGARIRGQDNMVQMSGTLSGAKLLVHYTVDTYGLVKDVWILRPEEAAVRPWPATPEQAETWAFDPIAQTWAKP